MDSPTELSPKGSVKEVAENALLDNEEDINQVLESSSKNSLKEVAESALLDNEDDINQILESSSKKSLKEVTESDLLDNEDDLNQILESSSKSSVKEVAESALLDNKDNINQILELSPRTSVKGVAEYAVESSPKTSEKHIAESPENLSQQVKSSPKTSLKNAAEETIDNEDYLSQLVESVPQEEELGQEGETAREDDEEENEGVQVVDTAEPKEDFFDMKNVEEKVYGTIEGMDAVTYDDDEERELAMREQEAQKLSYSVKSFAEGSVEQPRASVVQSIDEREEDQAIDQESEAIEERASRVSAMKRQDSEPRESRGVTIVDNTEVLQYEGSSKSRMSDHRRESKSMIPKQSMQYNIPTRLEESAADIMDFFNLDKSEPILFLDDLMDNAEEEEVKSEAEEEPEPLDRTPYYSTYDRLSEEIEFHRIKNNILQKKVIMYLKRRKVGNILKDVEPPLDQIVKYNQKLDAYQELKEVDRSQRQTFTEEVEVLRRKRDIKINLLNDLFKAMQTREGDVGFGLIHTKTGNPIPDKLVERLIRRQKSQMEQVASMRLKYIKLKGMVQEKLDGIEKLDLIGDNLHLVDYEQLKSENRNLSDKLEERDEELTRLRAKCQSTIQILAHMREKSCALDVDLCDLKEDLEDLADIAMSRRAFLAQYKHEKDKYRSAILKLKNESGLLTQPDLLRDMEASQEEVVKIEAELTACIEDCELKTSQVRTIRRNIEKLTEVINKKKAAKARHDRISRTEASVKSVAIESKADSASRMTDGYRLSLPMVYKGRPTLLMPVIKSGAFDDLVKIRPNPKVSNRRRR